MDGQDFPRLASSVFRITYHQLESITEVTNKGEVIGTWIPASRGAAASAASAGAPHPVGAEGTAPPLPEAPDFEGSSPAPSGRGQQPIGQAAGGRSQSTAAPARPFTPAPKPSKIKRGER